MGRAHAARLRSRWILERLRSPLAAARGGGVGSHYCFDHVDYDGIVIPTLRRVVPRVPEPDVFGPSAVLIQIANAIIE